MNQMQPISAETVHPILPAAERAVRALPPAFPLEASVAVNPFLGQGHLTLAQTSELMARLEGTDIAPSRDWFLARISEGLILEEDMAAALAAAPVPGIASVQDLVAAARHAKREPRAIPDIATLAAGIDGTDWPRLVTERLGAFCAGYFDQGQALWTVSRTGGAYAAWRLHAMHDLTPEIAGLKGFASTVAALPLDPRQAILQACAELGLEQEPGHYFHKLLLGFGGYGQYARQLQFSAERDAGGDETAIALLAMRLSFEAALFRLHERAIEGSWANALAAYREPLVPHPDRLIDACLQDAAERASARRLAASLEATCLSAGLYADETPSGQPAVQAAFCIDVRSEVFRRALETADPQVQTLGFAGFFGIGTAHRETASDLVQHRLPVLLPAGNFSCTDVTTQTDASLRLRARAARAFGRFRQAAVSSFAFIEAMGPVYAGKLLADCLRIRQSPAPAARPVFAPALPLEEKAKMAEAVLRAMSLTDRFARVVLLAGHGAKSANNPFSSALQCGACGGHAGDVNARLLALVLNDPEVRERLGANGILIPQDTLFLAGLHDTTTDRVTLYGEDVDISGHETDLARLAETLAAAGRLARTERAMRLPRASEAGASGRSRDWSEVRPEWALAGCTAFIAAPRSLTLGRSLEGKAFLHDYVWQKDEGFRVLELILTAPVVVASWINLQYFGSSVAPALFGAGNKLLHNVVGGIGVLEGNGGPMRTGLPWQSVSDGERLVHDPLRLCVFVHAPEWAVTDVLARHPGLRQMFDKGWASLLVTGQATGQTLRYAGGLSWSPA